MVNSGSEPLAGDLVLGLCERGDKRYLKAQLLDGTKDLLAPLLDARVTRITRNGMVIKGNEMTSRVPGSIKSKISAALHRRKQPLLGERMNSSTDVAALRSSRKKNRPGGRFK